jgi:hypothetical protein
LQINQAIRIPGANVGEFGLLLLLAAKAAIGAAIVQTSG